MRNSHRVHFATWWKRVASTRPVRRYTRFTHREPRPEALHAVGETHLGVRLDEAVGVVVLHGVTPPGDSSIHAIRRTIPQRKKGAMLFYRAVDGRRSACHPTSNKSTSGRAFCTLRPRHQSPKQTGGAVGEGWETQLRPDWGDVSIDSLGERSPVLKRAMLPSDGAPTVVAITGAPAELRAMFPIGRQVRAAFVCFGNSFRRTGPAFPTACPPPLYLIWGSRPWTARGKRSLPSPAPGRSPQPPLQATVEFRLGTPHYPVPA